MILHFNKKENSNILLGILFVLFLLFLLSPLFHSIISKLLSSSDTTHFFISRLYYWICLLLIWLYCIKIEKKNIVLWKEKQHGLKFFFVSFISVFLLSIAVLLLIKGILTLANVNNDSNHLTKMLDQLRANKSLLVFTALTAGIVEELIFRGYLQPRFEILFKNKWIAIIITSILFGILHYNYGTLYNVLAPLFLSLIFSIHYKKYNSLKFLILFHFLWDLLALFIAKSS